MEYPALHNALHLACQPTHAGKICQGRQQILDMDRTLVINRIEQVAQDTLNLTDYWEYRRFLEMCEMLDPSLVQQRFRESESRELPVCRGRLENGQKIAVKLSKCDLAKSPNLFIYNAIAAFRNIA